MNRQRMVKPSRMSSLTEDWFLRPKASSSNGEQLIEKSVEDIVNRVRAEGDSAVIEFTRIFDGIDMEGVRLHVTAEEIDKAYDEVSEEQVAALRWLKGRVEEVEKNILKGARTECERDGVLIRSLTYPLESVGCYVPGGEAAYPSTLLMTSIPAKIAGVPRTIVCSPLSKTGSIDPLVLVAADICKVDEIYKIGGAQAVAAMAYGTESIRPVRKIVGPGNRYVTKAKLLVSRDVAVDMPAGPSEVLILADESANPKSVALDMVSQAEHGADSVAGLLTTSERIAETVADELSEMVQNVQRSSIVMKALSENGFIIICEGIEEMIRLANLFAPEHVEIMLQNPASVIDQLCSAGLVLLGPYSPVSLSDYAAGTNHVLPTGGFGHMHSGLSVLDFIRRVHVVQCSEEGLRHVENKVSVLAEAEGLPNHYMAVKGRFRNEDSS